MQKTFLLVLSLLTTAGCKKDEKTPKVSHCYKGCEDIPMSIAVDTASYTDAERDTVIIRRYEGGGAFSQLADSSLKVVTPDTGQYTTRFAYVQHSVHGDGYDYEVAIPGAGQAYRIWNIKAVNAVDEITSTDLGCGYIEYHYHCSEPVKDFEISGGTYSMEPNYPGSSYANVIILKH